MVGPQTAENRVADIIAMAKAKPGKVTFASSGNGSVLHLSGVLLANKKAGVEMLHVPYKGAAPALLDVIAGRVDMMIVNGPSAVGEVKGHKLKALAVTTAKRAEALPDVPTMIEAGFPDYNLSSWFGVLAPSGIPDAVRTKINVAIGKLCKSLPPASASRPWERRSVPQGTLRRSLASSRASWRNGAPSCRTSGARVD